MLELGVPDSLLISIASIINLSSFYSIDTDRFLDKHVDRIRKYNSFHFCELPSQNELSDYVLTLESNYVALLDIHGVNKIIGEELYGVVETSRVKRFEMELFNTLSFIDYGMYMDEIRHNVSSLDLYSDKAVGLHLEQGIKFHTIPYITVYLLEIEEDKIKERSYLKISFLKDSFDNFVFDHNLI